MHHDDTGRQCSGTNAHGSADAHELEHAMSAELAGNCGIAPCFGMGNIVLGEGIIYEEAVSAGRFTILIVLPAGLAAAKMALDGLCALLADNARFI